MQNVYDENPTNVKSQIVIGMAPVQKLDKKSNISVVLVMMNRFLKIGIV